MGLLCVICCVLLPVGQLVGVPVVAVAVVLVLGAITGFGELARFGERGKNNLKAKLTAEMLHIGDGYSIIRKTTVAEAPIRVETHHLIGPVHLGQQRCAGISGSSAARMGDEAGLAVGVILREGGSTRDQQTTAVFKHRH